MEFMWAVNHLFKFFEYWWCQAPLVDKSVFCTPAVDSQKTMKEDSTITESSNLTFL
ncbi:MAG: hypothetical protein ACO1OT_14365 [Heyndrickxia sp.]